MTAVLHALQNNENVPLARISKRLVELADTMAKIDLAPVLSDGDLHRLAARGLEGIGISRELDRSASSRG